MRLDSINNSMAFASRKSNKEENAAKTAEKKANAQAARKRYFEYISKIDTNEKMKLSKGREEENGKFTLAHDMLALSSVVAGTTGIVKGIKAINMAKEVAAKGKEVIAQEAPKVMKKVRNAKILTTGAIALAAASLAVERINAARADKTSRKRGFMTEQEKFSFNNAKDAISATEKEYEKHTK